MKGLPLHTPLERLQKSTIVQVCIGEHQCQFHFVNGDWLAVEGRLLLGRSRSAPVDVSEYSKHGSQLCALLGQSVSSARRLDTGGLRVDCDGDLAAVCEVDTPQYECF